MYFQDMLMLAFRDDINGHEAAKAYAEDYRSPGKLRVTVGRSDATDAGDYDADRFSEAEGCYVLRADKGVAFTLSAGPTARMFPAFKIKGWIGDAPAPGRLPFGRGASGPIAEREEGA